MFQLIIAAKRLVAWQPAGPVRRQPAVAPAPVQPVCMPALPQQRQLVAAVLAVVAPVALGSALPSQLAAAAAAVGPRLAAEAVGFAPGLAAAVPVVGLVVREGSFVAAQLLPAAVAAVGALAVPSPPAGLVAVAAAQPAAAAPAAESVIAAASAATPGSWPPRPPAPA